MHIIQKTVRHVTCVALAFATTSCISNTMPEESMDSVTLALVSVEDEPFRFRACLVNRGQSPVVLDRYMRTYFYLHVTTDNGAIDSLCGDTLERPTDLSARFRPIEPGEEIEISYDLLGPNPVFECMIPFNENGGMKPIGYEASVRYPISIETMNIMVQVRYNNEHIPPAAFEGWYGVKPSEIGVWKGNLKSNVLVLKGETGVIQKAPIKTGIE